MPGFQVALPDVEALLGQDHDGATLGGLVGQRSQLRRVGKVAVGVLTDGVEARRHPVAHRDRARLVQQQGLDVAGCLDGPAAHGEDVLLHQAVHAHDPDRGQQGSDGRGDEAHEQGHQDDNRDRGARVDAERLE